MPSSPFIDVLRAEAPRLPPGPHAQPPEDIRRIHRARLVAGMAEAAAEKGHASTTIADVVAAAQVSRRTFYDHFADKDACFLAAYEASSDLVMAVVARAVDDATGDWRERIAAGVRAYLRTLAGEPGLTRVFLVEVLAAGPQALRHRRAVHSRFADLVEELVARHRDELPPGASLDRPMADALIGAVNELVLLAVEDGRTRELPALEHTATRLLEAVLA